MSPHEDTDRLAAASLAAGDPTGWFEQLYVEAEAGEASVPWDRPAPTALLVEWIARTGGSGSVPVGPASGSAGSGSAGSGSAGSGSAGSGSAGSIGSGLVGAGKRAVVVGCGLGRDAEFVAGLGFATTAFDVAETAVRVARERHTGSPVDYRVADLLDLPGEWRHGFDLVVESNNVQALPRSLRERATTAVGSLVAPGGTLLVLAAAATEWGEDGPPWPLTRDEVSGFGVGGLREESVELIPAEDDPLVTRWRAVFRRVG
jgi:SAM-dependent methyltransferase